MLKSLVIALSLAATTLPSLAAQDSYWIAHRNSNDVMEVSAWGTVLRRIPTGAGMRSAHQAPDGKIWFVRFSTNFVDILDPATNVITPIPTAGTPYDLAFDAAGHAWVVVGNSSVVELDAAGSVVQTLTGVGIALRGMTIDSLGNKWFADYAAFTTPQIPSLSRIDGITGAISTVPLPGVTVRPVRPVADYRGLSQPSHIWVTGDATQSQGQLIELDPSGAVINIYLLPTAQVGGTGPVVDNSGSIWTGDFLTGNVYKTDPTNGITTTYSHPPRSNGLAVDSVGRIWSTARVSLFSGVGAPCEVNRINPTTGALELPTVLELGGNGAYGSQTAIATAHHYSLVVAPFGDIDGDGDVNWAEVQAGTSPTDASSDSVFSMYTAGTTAIGNTPTVEITSSALWIVGYADGVIPPTPVPGFSGNLLINPGLLITTATGMGSSSTPLAIPNSPALQGFEVFLQGVILAGGVIEFRNLSGLRIW
ncbi:MAG: streptogramin lyase [Hyphomicrobiaceae bacterium]|jgi:streptogramin lyase